MTRTLLALVIGTGLVASSALCHADDIDALGGKVTELDARVYELDKQLKPPPEPGPEMAENRLIDAQVLYELKNYEAASIILFDVVDKYPNSAAYPEALFYLADSLYLKRDYLSSRRYFEKIVDVGPSNPRYQEALQRLIELSLHTGDYSPVDGYIAKLHGLAVDKQLPSVPYVEGKYYYFRRQFDQSMQILKTLGADHPYYFHALYFIGADQVQLGPDHLDEALQTFGTLCKATPKTDSQKRIVELAHMAMARIYLDRGQLTSSLDEYSKIGPKSESFNEMLYESAWVAIKGKDYLRAKRQLDLLLLNAPDSPLAPEVKLLIGNLSVRQGDYGPATDAFTKTRDEYAPLHQQMQDQLAKGDMAAYFRDQLAKNLSRFDINVVVAGKAARWVGTQPDVERVSTLIGDENDIRKSLDESDEIISRLEKALAGPQRVNVFPELAEARARATTIGNELTDVKKQLAEAQAKLLEPVAGAQKAELDQLEQQRAALESRLVQLPVKLAGIQEQQNKARAAYNDLDRKASELNARLATLRQDVDASRKLYEAAAQKAGKFDPTPPPAAPAAPPPADASQPYAARVQALSTRIQQATDQVTRLDARVSKLKDLVLKTPEQAKTEVDGATYDGETVQVALDAIRRDILDAAATIGVGDADMQAAAQLKAQYEDLLKHQHDLGVEVRSRLDAGDRSKAEQIESILDRAAAVDQKIAAFNVRIDQMLDARLKDIQASLADEKAHVASYRETLGGYTGETSDVGGSILADNYKSVAERFYNIVVRSDVGIIDVAWALKDSATHETNKLLAERKRELKLLDDEFKDVLKEHP